MALQFNFTAPSGVNAPECYVYIQSLITVGDTTTFTMYYYFSKANKDNGDQPIYTEGNFVFKQDDTSSAKPYRKQAYEYAKTLDKFKDAIDILEDGQVA